MATFTGSPIASAFPAANDLFNYAASAQAGLNVAQTRQNQADAQTARDNYAGVAAGDPNAIARAGIANPQGTLAALSGITQARTSQQAQQSQQIQTRGGFSGAVLNALPEQRDAVYASFAKQMQGMGINVPDTNPGDATLLAWRNASIPVDKQIDYNAGMLRANGTGPLGMPPTGGNYGVPSVPAAAGTGASTIPSNGSSTSAPDFNASLINSESGGDPTQVNSGGYTGKYQFGTARLADLGLYQPAPGENLKTNQWAGQLSIPGFPNVKTQADFKANPAAQDAAYGAQISNIDQAIAATPGASSLDQNGLRAVAHLGGVGGMQKFVASGGKYDPADSNGTHLSDYYRRFAGTGAPTQTAGVTPVGQTPLPAPAAPYQTASTAGTTGLPATANDASPSLSGSDGATAPPPAAPTTVPRSNGSTEMASNPAPLPSGDQPMGNPPPPSGTMAGPLGAALTGLREGRIPPPAQGVPTASLDPMNNPGAPRPNALLASAGSALASPAAPNALLPIASPQAASPTGQPQPPQVGEHHYTALGYAQQILALPDAQQPAAYAQAVQDLAGQGIQVAPNYPGKTGLQKFVNSVPPRQGPATGQPAQAAPLATPPGLQASPSPTSAPAAPAAPAVTPGRGGSIVVNGQTWLPLTDANGKMPPIEGQPGYSLYLNPQTGQKQAFLMPGAPGAAFGRNTPIKGPDGGTTLFDGHGNPIAQVGANMLPIQQEAYKNDAAALQTIQQAGQQAQSNQIRLHQMRDLLDGFQGGAGGTSRAQLQNYVETAFGPSVAADFAKKITGVNDVAAAQEFTKLGITGAGQDERAAVGSNGGIQATRLFQSANPGLDLANGASRNIINTRLIAAQADADYAQGAAQHVNDQYAGMINHKGYTPLSSFNQQWQQQRNPQVYAAAMGALNGQPFDKWRAGLSPQEGQRVVQILRKVDLPNTMIQWKGGPVPIGGPDGQ